MNRHDQVCVNKVIMEGRGGGLKDSERIVGTIKLSGKYVSAAPLGHTLESQTDLRSGHLAQNSIGCTIIHANTTRSLLVTSGKPITA